MEIYEVMRTAGAVRSFTDTPVPDDVLTRVLDHARFAPSGGNRQPWTVIVVREPELRRRIRDLSVLGWREYVAHLRAGVVPFAPGEDGVWRGPAVDLEEAATTEAPAPFVDELDTVPLLLVITVRLGDLAVLDNGLGRQSVVGGASVYPFVQNLLLAARNEGLGGVMTTFLCRRETEAAALLHVPTGTAIAAVVALGYPVQTVRSLTRRGVEDFARIDAFDGRPWPPDAQSSASSAPTGS